MKASLKGNGRPVALIVDDEAAICETLAGVLSDEGWDSYTAFSGNEGLSLFKNEHPDLVVLDVWMEGMDGIETLQRMKAVDKNVPILIMSGHGTIETAVRATKLGASNFIEKPLSLEKFLAMVDQAYESSRKLRHKSHHAKKYDMVGESEAIHSVRRQVGVVAPRNSWVLITGENGSGKEVVARNIHLLSPRSDRPFVAVNCAAIPEELIESELFGHVKGAFTNAVSMKRGKFELAHRGTLFLDEIADMSLKTQAKVLRILQEQSFERVGSDETINIDVRVIAATNKNLQEEIKQGKFREDLFYRLNVIPISVPPLRERISDIPILVEHFLNLMAIELDEKKKVFSDEAMKRLISYHWPGNVRELKNFLERLCILVVSPIIDVPELPSLGGDSEPLDGGIGRNAESIDFIDAKPGLSLKEAKVEFEKTFIIKRLEENDWNVSKTADSIGIERSNLHRKLRFYEIDLKRLKG
ncbi:MAG: sigma-54 dependent transcriptional regulator [Bdellovibrionota bacterium]